MKRVILAAAVAALSLEVMAETTRDYVQDGLVACWDGIENGGTARTHVSRTPGETFLWRDVVGNRAFTMLSDAQIEPDRVRFLDTADSRGSLTAADSAATFDVCRTGTVEFVFFGGSADTTAIFLYASGNSGVVVGRKSSCFVLSYGKSNNRTSSQTCVNATNTFALTYSDGLLMSKGGLYVNGVSNAVGSASQTYGENSATESWIGGSASGATTCNGAIYAIRCYSRKLTPEEIAANAAVDAERFFGGRGVTFSQTAANALSATLTADVNEELATGCSAKVCYGASPDALTETQAFGETFGEAGSYDITIRGLAPATTNYAQLVLTSGNSETPVYPVIAFTTAAVKPLPSGTGIGRGLKDYAQTGLVAHWDGVKNVGANSVHSDETKRWVDCLGGRAFDLRGVTVGDSYLQFAGATTSYGVLDAAGTKDIFETYGPTGTIEIAFMETKSANSIVLKSTFASGVAIGWTSNSGTILSSAGSNNPTLPNHKPDTYLNKFYVISPNYTKKAYAAKVYVNGELKNATGSSYWGTDVSGTYIGRRGGGTENPYTGKIYAIRVYDHNLTAEEAAQNYAVDVERFVNGNCAEPGDLRIEGGRGTSVPVEGLYEGLAVGETVACRVAAEMADPETDSVYVSTGYTIYTNGAVCAEGTTNEFTYVHPDCATGAKLVWRWAQTHPIEISPSLSVASSAVGSSEIAAQVPGLGYKTFAGTLTFAYGTTRALLDGTVTVAVDDMGEWRATIPYLTSGKTYYVQATLTSAAGTVTSEICKFTQPTLFEEGCATAQFYAKQDRLVGHWDGLENAGFGHHDTAATDWVDLSAGHHDLTAIGGLGAFTDDGTFKKTGAVAKKFAFGIKNIKTYEVVYDLSGYASGGGWIVPLSTTDKYYPTLRILDGYLEVFTGYKFRAIKIPHETGGKLTVASTQTGKFYVNGVEAQAGTTTYYWGTNEDNTFGASGVTQATKDTVGHGFCAIRLYDAELTAEEIAANAEIDRCRYIDHEAVGTPLALELQGGRPTLTLPASDAAWTVELYAGGEYGGVDGWGAAIATTNLVVGETTVSFAKPAGWGSTAFFARAKITDGETVHWSTTLVWQPAAPIGMDAQLTLASTAFSTAEIAANVIGIGKTASAATLTFAYGTTPAVADGAVRVDVNDAGEWRGTLPRLTAGQTYYVKATLSNGVDADVTSDVLPFNQDVAEEGCGKSDDPVLNVALTADWQELLDLGERIVPADWSGFSVGAGYVSGNGTNVDIERGRHLRVQDDGTLEFQYILEKTDYLKIAKAALKVEDGALYVKQLGSFYATTGAYPLDRADADSPDQTYSPAKTVNYYQITKLTAEFSADYELRPGADGLVLGLDAVNAVRTVSLCSGGGYGGTDDWTATSDPVTVDAGGTTAGFALPDGWGETVFYARARIRQGDAIYWSKTLVWQDPSIPVVAIDSLDGLGGDTLIVKGTVDCVGTGPCTLTVSTGASADALDCVWTGLADATLTAAGEYTLTLLETDTEAARHLAYGETYFVRVEATDAAGRVAWSTVKEVTMASPAVFKSSAVACSKRVMTVTAQMADLGICGTVDVELWVGEDESSLAKVAGPVTVTVTDKDFTLEYELPAYETTYVWQLRAKNVTAGRSASPVTTAASPVTTTTSTVNAPDLTTYTWTGAGETNNWCNAANWDNDKEGDCLGYPQTKNATAKFDRNSVVELDLPATSNAGTLNLSATGIDVTFHAADTNEHRLVLNGLSVPGKNSRWTLDHAGVYRSGEQIWAAGSTVVLTNGANLYITSFRFDNANATVMVLDESWLDIGEFRGGNRGLVVVSNATVNARSHDYIGYNAGEMTVRFEGTHPKWRHTGAGNHFRAPSATSAAHLDFLVPVGGYESAPCEATVATTVEMGNNGTGTSKTYSFTVNVLSNSPAARVDATITTPLIAWPGAGINTNMVVEGTLPAEKTGTAFVWGDGAAPATLDVTVAGSSHADRLTVLGVFEEVPDIVIEPAYGDHDGLVAQQLVAPAEPVEYAGGTRRVVCIGWKLYDVDPATQELGAEPVAEGETNVCDWTPAGHWQALIWRWRVEMKVTASAEAGGSVSSGLEWIIDGSNTVFTATPDDGYEFLMWRGEVVRFDAALSTLVTVPQAFTAVFAPVAKRQKVWTGLGGTTSWEDAGNWDPNGVPTLADDVTIPSGTYVAVPNGAVRANSIALADKAELHLEAEANELLVGKGGVSLVGASKLFVNTNKNVSVGDTIAVAGDFSAAGTSAVTIYAGRGPTDTPDWRDFKRGGTAVDIAGAFTLSGKATVAADAHSVTGLGVVFNVGRADIGAGAKFSSLGWPKGKGPGYKSGSGGSYGGIGNGSTAAYLYGFAMAPYQPGSGGGSQPGGGSIRIAATGEVAVAGTLYAVGPNCSGYGTSAGSGGGIWITCADFLPAEGASVNAGGANGTGHDGAVPGGGGRVVVFTGSPTERQVEELYAAGSCGQMTVLSTNMNDETTCSYPTVVNVKGGKKVNGTLAGSGTSVLMKNSVGLVQIEVKGDVYTPLATPSYGLDLKFAGEHTFTVPKYVDVSGGEFTAASVSRYECLGYEWTDAEGTVHTGGDTNVTLDVTGDISFRWIWSAVQHHFTMISGGYGSVSAHDDWYAEGTEVAIVATPDVDCNFVRWAGETTAADTTAASSTIVLDKPRRVTAVFDKPGVADRNFSISGDIDWFDPAAWDGTAIPTTNDTVTVTNNTTIELSSVMDVKALVVSAGTVTFAGNDTAIALNVVEGLTVENKAAMTLGAGSRKAFTDLTVGGDLTLNGSGTLTIYAGGGAVTSPVWTDFKRGGSKVDVGGSIVLNGTSSIATSSHAVNGLGVVFNVGGDVTLASGTKISSLGWPAGRGLGYKSGACGSYGGIGHSSTAAYLYGFAAAPYQPGSGGGGRQGGGSIRLAVTGNVNLSGTISTRGVAATGSSDYAGSGGGIWITCADFLPVEGASVDAGGGMANGGNSGAAPGGGGRVAIFTGSPTTEQIDALYATGECANAAILSTNMNDETTCSYPTLVYVAGGKRTNGTTAGAGTSYLLKNLGDRVSVEVKGNVYTPLATPVYGLELYEPGELEFTVPKYIDVSGGEFTDASVSRYECLGYVCSNATAEICHGTDTNVTVNIAGDTTLTWIWSKVQHHFTMISGGYGSVSAHDDWYAEGTEVAIVATPDADCNFVRWAGETTAADASAASSTVVMDRPRRVAAVFDKPGVADRTLAISGDIDWYDPAAWDGMAIPTTNDTVTVTNSTTIALTSVMEVRSLVVSAGTLTFATGSDIPVELRVTDGIVVENGAKVVMGDANRKAFTDLTVGGDLVLNGSGTFTIYAGGGAVTSPAWTDFKRGGSKVDVGGDFVLGGTSRFETYVNRKNGLGVVFNVGGDATIAAGATIRALGHTYLNFGLSSNFKYAPYHAGTGEYGAGGGTVRLAIAGKLDLAGRVDASGNVGGGMGNAGTGGAVWITCGQLIVTDGAFVTVGGGNTSGHSSSEGGVGGALAIMTGAPTAAQIDSLYVAGDCEERLVVTEDMSDTETSPYPTLTSCLGGTSPDSKPRRPSGTAVMLQNKANQAIVAVGGNVYTDTTEPIYGTASHDLGELMFEAPEYFYSEDGLSRYRCLGYEWSDLAGRSGSGLETWAVVDIRSDTTFTWKWSKIQHRLRTISGGYGSVAGNDEWYEEGATATLTANAGPNCAFVRWVGEFDYDGARERRSVLSLAMSRPREVIAMFRGAAPRTLTWNAASADLDWFNAANWDGEAIPSAIDAVVFTNGKFRVRHPAVIETAAWTQGGRTVGFVGTETNVLSSTITYVKPLDAANSNGYAIAVGGAMALADSAKLWFGGVNAAARHDLAVGGDLTLGNTAELEVYAGEGGDPDDWTTFRNGGAKIAVKGDLTLADKSVLLPVCHQRTGAPTVIEVVRSVRIGATAKINADNRGYARLNGVSYGPGTHGTSSSTAYGGSYGGIGGGASPSWFPNGIGYLLAPMHPGSPGSGSSQFMAGGAVRLTANRLYLDGTISASGGNMSYGGNTYGGSGGGVWLTVRKFFPGEGFSINANGGGTYSGYAGGGGRIAVMIGSREPVVEALYRDKVCPRAKVSDMTALDDWKDRVSVLGGGNRGGGALPGNSGTARLVIAPPAGTVIIVR